MAHSPESGLQGVAGPAAQGPREWPSGSGQAALPSDAQMQRSPPPSSPGVGRVPFLVVVGPVAKILPGCQREVTNSCQRSPAAPRGRSRPSPPLAPSASRKSAGEEPPPRDIAQGQHPHLHGDRLQWPCPQPEGRGLTGLEPRQGPLGCFPGCPPAPHSRAIPTKCRSGARPACLFTCRSELQ